MLGFQILSSTARERSQTAVVDVQAHICATQARIADPKAGELDWSARRDPADHWANMPGVQEAPAGVSTASDDQNGAAQWRGNACESVKTQGESVEEKKTN